MYDDDKKQPTATDLVKRQAKNIAKRKAKKALYKAFKKIGGAAIKKAITSFIAAFINMIVTGLGALVAALGPVLLAVLGVVIIFIAISGFLSWGSSSLDEESYGKKLADYVVEASNETVDMSKPEQVRFRVPEDLLLASAQIYDSMIQSEKDEELTDKELFKHEKKLVKKMAKALEPDFIYETIVYYTEKEITSCDDKGECTTETVSVKHEESRLAKVIAWDRIVTFDNQVTEGGWGGSTTTEKTEPTFKDKINSEGKVEVVKGTIVKGTETVREKEVSISSTENGTIDYQKFDTFLKSKFDYTEKDLKAVEGIYKVLGNSIVESGGNGGGPAYAVNGVYNFDIRTGVNDVTAAQINSKLRGLLAGKGQAYIDAGRKNGVNPAFLAAVNMSESGGTSNAIRKYNNVGGFMKSGGGHMTFPSIDASIEYMGGLMVRMYLNDGFFTVEQIHTRYSPDGAKNDPNGLNSNWVRNVYSFLNAMGVPLTKVEDNSGKKDKPQEDKPSEDSNNTVDKNGTTDKEEPTTSPASSNLLANPIFYTEWLEGKEITYFDLGANSGGSSSDGGGSNIGGKVDTSGLDKSKLGLILPTVNGVFTSGFGPRWGANHFAVDIASPGTVPNVAVADGVVVRSYTSSTYGECVIIRHKLDGKQYESLYAHMRSGSRRVKTGDTVKQGQVLGIQGNTGASKGQHCHFEWHIGSWNAAKSNAIDPVLVLPSIPGYK